MTFPLSSVNSHSPYLDVVYSQANVPGTVWRKRMLVFITDKMHVCSWMNIIDYTISYRTTYQKQNVRALPFLNVTWIILEKLRC